MRFLRYIIKRKGQESKLIQSLILLIWQDLKDYKGLMRQGIGQNKVQLLIRV